MGGAGRSRTPLPHPAGARASARRIRPAPRVEPLEARLRHRATPELDKLLKMCQIFDCTLDDLVTDDLTARAAAASGESGAGVSG